ncbi:MAG: rhodanese-like domain-containing protein [Deltaproteobacteria bacterium]|nr:rhodanese-like domain-containing protein [Deltaproteobacteria bacterium]
MSRTYALSLALVTTTAFSMACSDAKKPTPAVEKTDTVVAKAEKPVEGAEKAKAEKPAEVKMPEVSVKELQKLISDKKAMVFDANGDATRSEFGTIPGATFLTSYREYDTSILPAEKDKTLVFYCSSSQCSASDGAAVRAKEAGHKDVHVLRAGIKGWVKEGAKVEAFTAKAAPAKEPVKADVKAEKES